MKGYLGEYLEDFTSQLFGEAEFPDEWLEEDIFSPDEFFLCKLDLADFGGGQLPNNGYLYIFIDKPSKITKGRVKLRFYDGELDACTDFNDGYFDYEPDFFGISKNKISTNEVIVNQSNNGILTLIEIGAEFLPEEFDIDKMSIVIPEEDLINHNYSAARIIF